MKRLPKAPRKARPKTRARSDEKKAERREAIVAAAGRLFDRAGFAALTMADVATKAGLAKGTVYLYFTTKEALVLALLLDELRAWFAGLGPALGASAHPASHSTEAHLAAAIARSLVERPRLVRLIVLVHLVLEQNLDDTTAADWKHAIATMMRAPATLFEARLGLRAGDGTKLLLYVNALVVGLGQMAAMPPSITRLLHDDPTLRPLAIDLEHDLTRSLTIVISGWPKA